MRTLEDFTPGPMTRLGPRRFSREDIIAFAVQFDPQPMHLDEEAGRNSLLGALAGSGWHMASIAMRMLNDGVLAQTAAHGVHRISDLRWLSPFMPDEDISLQVDVVAVSDMEGRADLGAVTFHLTLVAGANRVMMTVDPVVVIARRRALQEGGAQ